MRAVSTPGREPPTAVVLGAAGFVGRNVCTALSARGWSVAAVARRAVTGLAPGCRAVRLDLLRSPAAALALALAQERPALVVNAVGALWDVSDEELTDGNITLVRRLVDAVAGLPRPARLIHIGSAYEYGGHPPGRPLTETLRENPASRYARTKLAGTRVVTGAVAEGRLDAVVLRIAMSLGPHASPHSLLGGLACQLARNPAELRLPPVAGVRDIVDVRDVAEAVRCAADAPRVPPLVNVGSGVGVRLTDAVDTLLRITGSTATLVRSPAPAVRRDAGIGEEPLDIGLARRELGWAPARTLTDALSALWAAVPRTDGLLGTDGRPGGADGPRAAGATTAPPSTTSTPAVDGEPLHG